MNILTNLKIKHKILSLVGLNMLFFVLSGIFCYHALVQLDHSQQRLIANTSAIYSQMNADMMHDALRADVYKALVLENEKEDAQKALKIEFEQHKNTFQASLQQLATLDMNDSIRIAVQEITPALNRYIQQSEALIESVFQKDSTQIATGLDSFNASFDELADKMGALSLLITSNSELQKASANEIVFVNKMLIVSVLVISLIVIGYMGKRIAKHLSEPILEAKEALTKLSNGNLVKVAAIASKDEIGEMNQTLQVLINNLSNIKGFATEVGNGKFDSDVNVFNNSGELGSALATMRQSLKAISEEENKRNWMNTGLAQLNELLRVRNHSFAFVLDQVLSFIIKYTKANQGCISIVDATNPNDIHLNVQACYAYSRKKYMNKRMEVGEGLTGQVVLEKETIYLQEIPDSYVNITSGLGDANPSAILIVPLRVDDETVGVLEIASLEIIPAHYVQFVERACSSLGLHISNENKNMRTEKLLEMTQQQKEELQAQEEEVRQNMEELYATQEEVRRREGEYLKKIEELEYALSAVRQTQNVA